MEFVIVNVDESVASKPLLERIIFEHGGKCVANVMPSTTHLIAARVDFRVRNLIDTYGMNIIKYNWLLSCRDYEALIDFDPTFMIYTN